MQHPLKSLAEQKLDRTQCLAQSNGVPMKECMIARGYAPVEVEIDAFSFDG
jgi:hypothetical protein